MVPTPPQGVRSVGSTASNASETASVSASAAGGSSRSTASSPRVGFTGIDAPRGGASARATQEVSTEQLLEQAGGEASPYGLDRIE